MSQVRSGHRGCSRGERWPSHEPCQGGGGASERQEGRLAERQAEKKSDCVIWCCREVAAAVAARCRKQDHVRMRSRATDQILAALQTTVSAAVKQWLDENKREVMHIMQAAVAECMVDKCKHQQQRQQVNRSEFLTVTDVARRWQLHPETVREMLRQGRIPQMMVGRRHRVALSAVESLEKSGAVPCRR